MARAHVAALGGNGACRGGRGPSPPGRTRALEGVPRADALFPRPGLVGFRLSARESISQRTSGGQQYALISLSGDAVKLKVRQITSSVAALGSHQASLHAEGCTGLREALRHRDAVARDLLRGRL